MIKHCLHISVKIFQTWYDSVISVSQKKWFLITVEGWKTFEKKISQEGGGRGMEGTIIQEGRGYSISLFYYIYLL